MLPEQDRKKLDTLISWFHDSESVSSAHRSEVKENLAYFHGYQYDQQTINEAKDAKRGLITSNQIFKYLILMSGVERQSRQDIRVFPVGRGSDPMTADLLSLAIKNIDYHTASPFVRSDMYLAGQISDRAYIRWNLSFNGIFPVIGQDAPSPLDVFEDPNGRSYDFDNHRFIMQRFWMPKEELITKYGGENDALRAKIRSALTSREFESNNNFYKTENGVEYVAIVEAQSKKDTQIIWAYNPNTRDIINKVDKNDQKALVDAGYQIIYDNKKSGEITRFTSSLIFEDMPHYLPEGKFNISRYSPYFVMGEDTSLVAQLKSQQDEMNAARSQMNELVGRAPKGTIIYTKDSGLSKAEIEDMSALGGTFLVNDMDQIKIVETSSYYTALSAFVQLYGFSNKEFQDITGISDVLLGNLKSSTSGVVFSQAVNQAAVGLQMGLDNFQRTLVNHYKKLLPIIQRFFPSDKLLRLSGDQYRFIEKASKQQQAQELQNQTQQLLAAGDQQGAEQLSQELQKPEFATLEGSELKLFNQYNEILSSFNIDTGIGEYDVVVDASKSSFNQQTANLGVMIELLRVLPDIGPYVADLVIDAAPLPNKDVIVERLERGLQDIQAQKQQAQQADLLKEIIKQQGKGGLPNAE